VAVSPAASFSVDRAPAPHAVRISLGGVRDRARLAPALQTIADTLARRTRAIRSVA
jgi:hypothetical protein